MAAQLEPPRGRWIMAAWHDDGHREPSPAIQNWMGAWFKLDPSLFGDGHPIIHAMGHITPALWFWPEAPDEQQE